RPARGFAENAAVTFPRHSRPSLPWEALEKRMWRTRVVRHSPPRSHSVEPWSSLRDHPNHTSHQRSPTRRARSPQRRTRPSPRRRLEEDLEKRVYRIHPSDRAATSTLSVMKGFAKARGNLRRRLHLHRISVER